MKFKFSAILIFVFQLLYLPLVMAQGMGEYGRVLGGSVRGSRRAGPGAPGVGIQQGRGVDHGVGDVGGRPLPRRLIVAVKAAALYPRQDDETDQIEKLSEGELLSPVMQSTRGGTEWYMVKTQEGVVGWVKSTEVKEQDTKKP